MSEQVSIEQASFVIESGANAGLRVSISAVLDGGRPAFLIGSDPRSHLQLSADALPAHAILLRRAGGYFLQPRFPHCVVLVNGRRINRPTCLLPGDVVQIGAVTLRFDQQAGEAAEPDDRPPLAGWTPAAPPAPAQPTAPPPVPALAPAGDEPPPVEPAAAAHEPIIYRPAAQVETGGIHLAAALLGVISVLAIVGVVAYGLLSGGGVQTSEAANFAYHDGNVTLLMFEASWCTFCKQQRPIVSALADEYRGDVYVEYVDIDNPRNRGLVTRFAARSVPLVVVMNDRGEVVATFRGLTPARSLRPALERALSQSTGTAVTSR